MVVITQGKEAFYNSLYFHNHAVLIITNAGAGEVLTLMLIDYGDMPVANLERLGAEVRDELKSNLGLT